MADRKRKNGLNIGQIEEEVNVINDPVLINDWHVVGRADDLKEGEVLPARLLGEDLVLWRSNGQVLAWQDLCLHRGARRTG